MLNENLYILKYNCHSMIYVQDRGIVVEVNSDSLKLLEGIKSTSITISQIEKIYPEFFKLLVQSGIIIDSKTKSQKNTSGNFNKPTSVTIFPSSDCNLRCIYCYGSAGENKLVIDQNIALRSIKFIIDNALVLKQKKIHVGFHGGGEPFWRKASKIVYACVSFAKEQCQKENIEVSFSAATNGILSSRTLNWIKKNKVHLQISLDGPAEIQNYNRPFYNGKHSFPYVIKTIRFLENNKLSYALRATITNQSVFLMKEIYDFF